MNLVLLELDRIHFMKNFFKLIKLLIQYEEIIEYVKPDNTSDLLIHMIEAGFICYENCMLNNEEYMRQHD